MAFAMLYPDMVDHLVVVDVAPVDYSLEGSSSDSTGVSVSDVVSSNGMAALQGASHQ